MTNTQARAEIVRLCAENGLYLVDWHQHFGHVVVAVRGRLKPEIYGAVYESYYDVVRDDEEVFRIKVKSKTWRGLLGQLARAKCFASFRKKKCQIASLTPLPRHSSATPPKRTKPL